MNSEKACELLRFKEVGGCNVCSEHALLNELMRIVTIDRHNGIDFSVFIEQYPGFHRLKVDSAACGSRLTQHLVECMQPEQAIQSLLRHTLAQPIHKDLANLCVR